MTKFKVEIQITLLALIIGAAVVTTGYFAYKSLSKIVSSIYQEARPDNKLFLIKDIASDLTALENRVRLYVLTDNSNDLQVFYSLETSIAQSIKKLNNLKEGNINDVALIDSLSKLSQEKHELWNKILKIHLSSENYFPVFSDIYSNLEEWKTDTSSIGTVNKEFLPDSLTGENAELNNALADRAREQYKIKRKLLSIEWENYKKSKLKNTLESRLIEKNVIIGLKINQLIIEAEKKEADKLLTKTIEADRMAEVTYKWLAIFTFSAVLLLVIALFVLYNYLKKTRAYQRALSDASKKAELLARAKEQFAANVSHELRTPVNAIFGLSEQVLQKPLERETSEMVSVIYKSASHLKNIINDTLDFSKIQANKIIFETVNFSPFELFEEVLSLQIYEATQKGISMYFNWQGERSGALVGDPLHLKQILINLISNAIKFTEKGEVAVIVKGSKTDQQSLELEIQISDTGIGIPENDLHVIFDEFVQIENQPGKKYSGTGLGLSIVKRLVELHGGKIKVESKVGKGTKVTVNICFKEGDTENIKKTEGESPLIPETFKQLSVLIADDEEYNRFLVKSILQKWGVKFKEAKNGNEVINVTQNEKFDVILMDINMPEMNGIEASKAITKINSGVTIVATTAANDRIDQQACINAGMKGFLLKPFSEKDLFDTLISVLPAENDTISANSSQQINMAELSRLANGDKKFLREMILLFIISMETGIANIEEAIRNENWNSIFENAHKIAAPSKQIGATNLYNNIKQLEKMAKKTVPMKSIFPVFQELKKEVTDLNVFLKSYLNEIETDSA
jgi:signal transduction histidine kinase/DNA-binding NarL/FixJ family response regulator